MTPIYNFTVPGTNRKYALFAEIEPSIIAEEKRRYLTLYKVNALTADEIAYFVQVIDKDSFSIQGKILCKHSSEKVAFHMAKDWLETEWDGKL